MIQPCTIPNTLSICEVCNALLGDGEDCGRCERRRLLIQLHSAGIRMARVYGQQVRMNGGTTDRSPKARAWVYGGMVLAGIGGSVAALHLVDCIVRWWLL